jgi:heptosyltransferase-3
MEQKPSLLVIRRRYLGDIVLLGSLLRNLRLYRPDGRITVLVEPRWAPILALNPDVDEAIGLPGGLSAWPGFVAGLRRARFTHVIDLDNTEKTALIARLTGAPVRIGIHHGTHPIKLGFLYSHVVHEAESVHEGQPMSDYYLKALGPAGVPVATREIRLVPREAEVLEWRRFVGAAGRTLLVHPGSRSAWRVWPHERFAAVCDRVQDELGVQAVLVGGPADRALVESIRSKAKVHLLTVSDPPTLTRLAALAAASTVMLCHDSGPMHVAAAVGTPVVALYGSQNPVLFSPHGVGHTQLIPPMPCASCDAPGQCIPADSYHNHCVRALTVDQVFVAVRDALTKAA